MGMTIEIIESTTGRPPSGKLIDRIAKEYGLIRTHIDQFALTEDGNLILMDDRGQCCYVDKDRFNLRVDFCEVEDG